MKKNIAVVMGGYSGEQEISLASGRVVSHHLNKDKFNVYPIIVDTDSWHYKDENQQIHLIDKSNFSLLLNGKSIEFDVVFNAIHGSPGEDGLLQAYFDLIGVKHTSCDFYQAALTFNKRDLLAVLAPLSIDIAPSYSLNKGDEIDTPAIVEKVGLPCFVKANKAGSSLGVLKVKEKTQIQAAITNAFHYDDEILIESFIDGREFSVGVCPLNDEIVALPITEIVTENEFFDYEAKYQGKAQEITPAKIEEPLRQKLAELSVFIYKKLKLKGFCRSEYIVKNNRVFLLEINTIPGLTAESIIPQQAISHGLSLEEFFESAIDQALKP
ncbi:MAG: D-alanine--D-alanine ligase [Flavobacteriaceae bacterium]|nr:D-alanine--D-alanine ligase [Flavobacteriaceae bacterium]